MMDLQANLQPCPHLHLSQPRTHTLLRQQLPQLCQWPILELLMELQPADSTISIVLYILVAAVLHLLHLHHRAAILQPSKVTLQVCPQLQGSSSQTILPSARFRGCRGGAINNNNLEDDVSKLHSDEKS